MYHATFYDDKFNNLLIFQIATNGAGFGGVGQGAYTYTQSGRSTYLGTNMPTQVYIVFFERIWVTDTC